jgi:hypothetical protein
MRASIRSTTPGSQSCRALADDSGGRLPRESACPLLTQSGHRRVSLRRPHSPSRAPVTSARHPFGSVEAFNLGRESKSVQHALRPYAPAITSRIVRLIRSRVYRAHVPAPSCVQRILLSVTRLGVSVTWIASTRSDRSYAQSGRGQGAACGIRALDDRGAVSAATRTLLF